MSANRSVQAAQRRRAGPPEPQMPGRAGPQPSINSSQMFSGQSQSQSQGQGRSQNTQVQRSVSQSSSGQKGDGINSINKMTVTQAIMLITLRLGAIEKKMMSENMSTMNTSISLEGQENMVLIERAVIESITNRLESLERRSTSTGSSPELALIKQQMETFRQSIVQTKGTVSKENKELKIQMDTLKQELTETKELLSALQNLTMDNSQKILAFSLEGDDMMELPDANSTDFDGSEELHGSEEIMGADFMGTDLKKLIENEMNSN